jgi:hypothetical protein
LEIFLTRVGVRRPRLGESSEAKLLVSLRIGRVLDHLYKLPPFINILIKRIIRLLDSRHFRIAMESRLRLLGHQGYTGRSWTRDGGDGGPLVFVG